MARFNPAAVYPPKNGIPAAQAFPVPASGVNLLGAQQNSFAAASLVGATYLFFIFSHAVEFIDTTGRLHLIVLLALVAVLAAISAGLIPKSFTSTPGICLTAFTLFLILGIPFSSWKGGSFRAFADSWWKSYLTFLLVASLVFTLHQLRRALFVLGVASVGILYFAIKSARTYEDGRLSVEYGSLGNSNDLAGALLMCLPFVMYIVLDSKRAAVIRMAFLGIAGFLLVMVVKTGSRSSLLVVAGMALIMFFQVSASNKIKILICCALVAGTFPFFVSKDLMARYATTFSSGSTSGLSDTAASAVMSTNARKELVHNAVVLTLKHPIFGVGMGNFSFQSAELEIAKGNLPLWYTCHDIYLLVSSETGVVGFLFYTATIVFTARILIKVRKASKNVAELDGVPQIAYCLLMALLAFGACGLFGTNAYNMQMPAIAALAVALDRIARPLLADAEERRMAQFRNSIPVLPSRFAGSAAAALSFR